MYTSIDEFFKKLKQKKVAVVGFGVSHFDMIRLFLKKGISVTVLDKRKKEDLDNSRMDILISEGAKFLLGDAYLSSLTDFDVLFRTPGMYFLSEALQSARKSGVAVVSEMEVFFELCPCRIYAVTGSDGKTTTSTLISEFFKAEGKTVHLGGNIGKALLPEIEKIRADDICVVELSSFQLISMRQSPNVAVITNITPNHLDVHKDMQEYIDAKKNILLHQDGFSRAVLNLDNEITASLAPLVRGKTCFFSRRNRPQNGSFLDKDGYLCRVENGVSRRVLNSKDIKIPGIHNVENYLTAIAAVSDEVSDDSIQKVAKTFGGVEHRIELVRTLNGVRYFNDSIASSPTRTIAGLHSFSQKLIVIAGGYDKNIPYAPLGPELCLHAKLLILLGATAPKIEKAVIDCPEFETSGLQILHVNTMEEAVAAARQNAVAGDVVTLSPASASFDLYHNFEERGHHFKQIVNNLSE